MYKNASARVKTAYNNGVNAVKDAWNNMVNMFSPARYMVTPEGFVGRVQYENGTNYAKSSGKSGGKGTKTSDKPVDIELKYKEDWTPQQRAEADAKVKALSEAETVKTPVDRKGTSASAKYKSEYGDQSVPEGYDVDHTIDLQLSGPDNPENMNPLDKSVNRSLGSQIYHAIKEFVDGTVFGNSTIK
ncbi:HNH endonuclease [Butyrivibrio sp. INlla14]|uniref:HNH endonuclease n=1 Tax=Butyrivibrio sp. INlla14 TaxID=1520808 RepID=UPI000876DFE4|nr:HNH endonuclease [Butyrivibrio sp. INlla14]SCY74938.1 hypothetical protein SAMN02910371_03716 [Butyrivibrio sp. INlla14]